MKLFIDNGNHNYIPGSEERTLIDADKISALSVGLTGSNHDEGIIGLTIEGGNIGVNSCSIWLGAANIDQANRLLRELCEFISRASASSETRAMFIECRGGSWREF